MCLRAEVPPIKPFTTDDGLASGQIDQIVADSRGFVWFCTPEGLSRFDGRRIVSYGVADGLPSPNVTAFLETRAGEDLIGTGAGLCAFRPGPGAKFVTYQPGNTRAQNSVSALFQDSAGRIWCGTRAGLFEMRNVHDFRPEPLPLPPGENRASISDLAEDPAHNLWMGSQNGVYVIGKTGTRHIALDQGQFGGVRALFAERGGQVWAATQRGLVLLRNQAGEIGVERVYRQLGEVRLDLTSLAEGPDGALWAGASAGLLRAMPGVRPEVFRLMTRTQGLIDRQVNSLARDRAGNMWVGTESAGAMKIQSAGFTTFGTPDGLTSDRIWSVLVDREGTAIAITATPEANGWVHVFDGARFHAMSLAGFTERNSWGHRILLQARDGAWWAATLRGLCRYGPAPASKLGSSRPLSCWVTDSSIYQVFEDSKGRVWASVDVPWRNRVLFWDPSARTVSPLAGWPHGPEFVRSFAEDRDGNIWMNLVTVLVRYDGRQFTRYQQGGGLPRGAIHNLFTDSSGQVWLATTAGLGVIHQSTGPHLGVRMYTTSDGLASNDVVTVIEDRAGRIYAGTTKGVDRLDPRTGHIKHFSTADGLARGNITGAICDRAGDIWFGTTQGLSRLSREADREPATPTVRITDVRFERDQYRVSPLGETHITHPDLQPSQNHFQISFVGFSDEPEANLHYQYKLEGGDSGWRGPSRDHEVNYDDLAPRAYKFLVNAVNSEGKASQTPAEIDFVILPPVWRRWWFETLDLGAVAGLVFAAHRRRLRHMTARVRQLYNERLDERTRIARELHDTLLQDLAGVSLQLEGVAKMIDGTSEVAASRIRTVRQQVDDSFVEARQKVLALRSPTLQGRSLPEVLRESLEKITAGQPVRFKLTVTGEPRPLREEVDEAVLRIGQEAVANAVRHAKASEIQASLDYGLRALRLRIQDDGRGFDPDAARQLVGHWGLRNMQERAQRIGAAWNVTTGPGRGTVIEAVIPLPEDN